MRLARLVGGSAMVDGVIRYEQNFEIFRQLRIDFPGCQVSIV